MNGMGKQGAQYNCQSWWKILVDEKTPGSAHEAVAKKRSRSAAN